MLQISNNESDSADMCLKWTFEAPSNGIIPLLVSNVDDLAARMRAKEQVGGIFKATSWNKWAVEVSVQGIEEFDSQNMSKNCKDCNWNTFSMNVGWMHPTPSRGDVFHVRVPFYLTDNDIQMKLRLVFNNEYFSDYSEIQRIKIASCLVVKSFNINDKVLLHHPHLKVLHAFQAIIIGKVIRMPNGEIKTITPLFESAKKAGHNNDNSNIDAFSDEDEDADTETDENNNGSVSGKIDNINTDVIEYVVKLDIGQEFIDYSDENNYIFNVDASQLASDKAIYQRNVVDTCNYGNYRLDMEYNLILGTNDKNLRQFYTNLRNTLSNIYNQENFLTLDESGFVAMFRYNFDFIGALFSNIICNYLFEINNNKNNNNKNQNRYKYQLRCFHNSSLNSKDKYLHFSTFWKHRFELWAKSQRLGMKGSPISQNFRSPFGSCCDMCSIFIHSNDWLGSCQQDNSHVYCLQCCYIMARAILKFKQFLKNVVHEYVDRHFTNDCIQIIVSFVIGDAKIV